MYNICMKFFYSFLIVTGLLIWIGYHVNKKEIQRKSLEYTQQKKILERAKSDMPIQQSYLHELNGRSMPYRDSHKEFQTECYTDATGETSCYDDYYPRYYSYYYQNVQTLGNPTGPVLDHKFRTVPLPSMNPERWYVRRPAYWNGTNRVELV